MRSRLLLSLAACAALLSSSCDPCANCGENASCQSRGGQTACACNEGYEGNGFTCTDVDECTSRPDGGPCGANAVCTNAPGRFSCACATGFSGDGGRCQDIDECAQANGGCDLNARCTNLMGGRSCMCSRGYLGSGEVCSDIDECAASNGGCFPGTSCTNTVGSRTCGPCPPGFTGPSGESCTDINECMMTTPRACPGVDTLCINQDGGFRCGCPVGFVGDGGSCSPRLSFLTVVGAGDGGVFFEPAFDPEWFDYTCEVPGNQSNATVVATRGGPDVVPVVGGSARDVVTYSTVPGFEALRVEAVARDVSSSNRTLYRLTVWRSQTLKGSVPDPDDRLGAAVAMSADGTVVAVSVPGEDSDTRGVDPAGAGSDNRAPETGAVMVYRFDTDIATWVQAAYIKPFNTGRGLRFGTALALSADGRTLAVGMPEENSVQRDGGGPTTPGAGAVFIYTQDVAFAWSLQAYLKASNARADGAFGAAVALSGGGDLLLVGSPGESSNARTINGNQAATSAPSAGAAYLFLRQGSTWTQDVYFKASNADALDRFGAAVAMSQDGGQLVVGAPGEASATAPMPGDNTAAGAGAAYVFEQAQPPDAGPLDDGGLPPGVWAQLAYLKAPNAGPMDGFGTTVSVGAEGLAVACGAPGEDSATTSLATADDAAAGAGAVYTFRRALTGYNHEGYLKAPRPAAGDDFGRWLAQSVDGFTLFVGVPGDDSAARGVNGRLDGGTADDSGAVYAFRRQTSREWLRTALIKAHRPGAGDRLGASFGSDGEGRLMCVGAPEEDSDGIGVNPADTTNDARANSGAAFILN